MTDPDALAQVTSWFVGPAPAAGDAPRLERPVLLLAVLQMAESGDLPTNQVPFNPALFESFAAYWRAVSDEPPGAVQHAFWHLDSEPFWDLVMPPDLDVERANKSYTPSARRVSEWVHHARLDARAFEAVRDDEARTHLRAAIVARHAPEREAQVAAVRAFERAVVSYVRSIRQPGEPGAAGVDVPERVRKTAFQRVVMGAYNDTCAVSRVRLTFPVGGAHQLVQAVRIQSESGPNGDAAQNGIALSPSYRWMFDRGLFTLDERWRIRVSPVARECLGTVDELLATHDKQQARLPADRDLWPGQDYLDWHRSERYLDR